MSSYWDTPAPEEAGPMAATFRAWSRQLDPVDDLTIILDAEHVEYEMTRYETGETDYATFRKQLPGIAIFRFGRVKGYTSVPVKRLWDLLDGTVPRCRERDTGEGAGESEPGA